MKTRIQNLVAAALLLPTLNIPFASVHAQGTAFTYQGMLNSGGGPAGGSYDLAFTLYDSTNLPGNVIGGPLTNSATGVTNGLFTTSLDFGPGVFTGNPRWLEIAVRTNGGGVFVTLAPRQLITPTPYAIMAGSASNLLGVLPAAQLSGMIPSSGISGTYSGPVTFNNGADTFDGTFVGQFFGSSFFGGSFNGNFFGDGSGLFNLNASQLIGTIPDSHLAGNVAFLNSNQVFTAQNVFAQGIGIGNPAPVFSVDAMSSQAVGRFISTNAYFGSVLVLQNQTTNLSSEFYGAINFNNSQGGTPGQMAYIVPNPTNQNYDFIRFTVGGGGGALTLQADPRGAGVSSMIGGTWWNYIDVGSGGDVIAGGGYPSIGNIIYSNSSGVFIGAGSANHVGPNVNDSVIVGGYGNTVSSWDAAIGGGVNNTIQTNAQYATISGGVLNYIDNGAFEAVIAGGNRNTNGPGAYRSFIGGGIYNSILAEAYESVIGGGYQNQIQPFASDSFIGSGYANSIYGDAIGQIDFYAVSSVISGGYGNVIQTNSGWSFVGGGFENTIQPYAREAVIGGGALNVIQGASNYWAANIIVGQTIGGGALNTIQANSAYATIAGGAQNTIQSNAPQATIAGGRGNVVLTNAVGSTVSGGNNNQAGGSGAVVPGGFGNAANGGRSFAAGTQAQATNDGAFVLADDEPINFYSTVNNQFSARFTGGIVFVTAGAGMTVDGQTVFAGNNGAALTGLNASQLTSGTVPGGALAGNYPNAVTFANAGNSFAGNGTGLTNVNAATLNGLTSSSFAQASGSANYIQNQNGSPQVASFNISGGGQFGGTVSATTLVVSNVIASGPITAPTVAANGVTGGNVSATTLAAANSLIVTNNAAIAGTVAANSLTITNTFRVVGAGINTGTAAFIQLSAVTNTSGDNTVIYNPLSDGDPNAILVVTHNYNPGMAFNTIYNKTVGVYYNGAHWAIYNEDLSAMPTNIAFNVLVIKH